MLKRETSSINVFVLPRFLLSELVFPSNFGFRASDFFSLHHASAVFGFGCQFAG